MEVYRLKTYLCLPVSSAISPLPSSDLSPSFRISSFFLSFSFRVPLSSSVIPLLSFSLFLSPCFHISSLFLCYFFLFPVSFVFLIYFLFLSFSLTFLFYSLLTSLFYYSDSFVPPTTSTPSGETQQIASTRKLHQIFLLNSSTVFFYIFQSSFSSYIYFTSLRYYRTFLVADWTCVS